MRIYIKMSGSKLVSSVFLLMTLFVQIPSDASEPKMSLASEQVVAELTQLNDSILAESARLTEKRDLERTLTGKTEMLRALIDNADRIKQVTDVAPEGLKDKLKILNTEIEKIKRTLNFAESSEQIEIHLNNLQTEYRIKKQILTDELRTRVNRNEINMQFQYLQTRLKEEQSNCNSYCLSYTKTVVISALSFWLGLEALDVYLDARMIKGYKMDGGEKTRVLLGSLPAAILTYYVSRCKLAKDRVDKYTKRLGELRPFVTSEIFN